MSSEGHVPYAHHDHDRLRAAYEEADGDIQAVAEQFPGVSADGIQKALVRAGIHDPVKYTSYVKLLEEMTVEEFDRIVHGGDA